MVIVIIFLYICTSTLLIKLEVMKMKFLFLFALLITLTGSYKEQAKASSNFVMTTEAFAPRGPLRPEFTVIPQDFDLWVGQNVTINASFVGSPPPTVDVYFEGRRVTMLETWIVVTTTDRSVSIRINRVKREYSGEYSIKLSNPSGTVESYFMLNIKDKPTS